MKQLFLVFVQSCSAGTAAGLSFLCSFIFDSQSIRSFRAYLSCARLQSRHSEQVVRGSDHVSSELRLHQPDETALPEPTHRLHPAEDLFDPLSLSLADGVALMSRGARIQTRSPALLDSRNVRGDVSRSEQADESLVVIALVSPERAHALPSLASAIKHGRRGLGLKQRRIGDRQIDEQSASVLHQRVRPEAELGGLAIALAHQLRLRVGARFVRGVGSLLAPEVHHARAVTPGARWLTILSLQALQQILQPVA